MVWTIWGRSEKGKPGHWTVEAILCLWGQWRLLFASISSPHLCLPPSTQCNRTTRKRPGLFKLNRTKVSLQWGGGSWPWECSLGVKEWERAWEVQEQETRRAPPSLTWWASAQQLPEKTVTSKGGSHKLTSIAAMGCVASSGWSKSKLTYGLPVGIHIPFPQWFSGQQMAVSSTCWIPPHLCGCSKGKGSYSDTWMTHSQHSGVT